jgi:hypothetical protein
MITLECNGVEQSLEGWGITRASLRLVSLAMDTFAFEISTNDMFAEQAFAYDDQINLYKDGDRIFTGSITKLPIIGNTREETQSFTASGPWYILSRVVYMQDRLIYLGFTPVPTVVPSSRATMFSPGTVTGHIGNGEMIEKAIAYAVDTFHVPIQFGECSLNIQPPLTEIRDITCADVIIYSAKWTPDSVSWFDYSVDPPAFYCKRRSELTQVNIDPKNEATNLINEMKITPRPDLQVKGVLFNFEQPVTVGGVQKVTVISQGAGDLTSIDLITHTFTLQGTTSYTPEAPPTGLAAAFFDATSTLQYEGEVTATEEECSLFMRTGNGLQFTANCPAIYRTMKALVQQVQYELVFGITTITFGPPTQLGPQDFNAMLAASRGVAPTSNMTESGSPDGGTGNPPVPVGPNPYPTTPPDPTGAQPHVILQLCEGGTVCVSGATGNCGT